MGVITVQKVSHSGIDPTLAAAANDDSFPNTGREYLQVDNASAAAITVTIDSTSNCSFGFDHNLSVSIPAGGKRLIGPFDTHRFGKTISPVYSAITSVTRAVVQVS